MKHFIILQSFYKEAGVTLFMTSALVKPYAFFSLSLKLVKKQVFKTVN